MDVWKKSDLPGLTQQLVCPYMVSGLRVAATKKIFDEPSLAKAPV